MAKKIKAIRLSEETEKLLEALAKKRQSTQSSIVDESIRDMAKKEKIQL